MVNAIKVKVIIRYKEKGYQSAIKVMLLIRYNG